MELKDITKEAVVVGYETTLEEAVNRMLKSQANVLLVTDEDGILVGEVTISDLFDGAIPLSTNGDDAMKHFESETAFKEALRAAKDNSVSDFMSSDFSTVYPSDTIMDVAATAIAQQRAQIPVVDHDNRPLGIISRRELKQILAEYLS